jgi:hypothetical protein
MKHLILGCLLFYRRFLSPLVGGGCLYSPSCSQYALECVRRHGAWIGVKLTVQRLRRCDGSQRGGDDPVPEADQVDRALRGELVVVRLRPFDFLDADPGAA